MASTALPISATDLARTYRSRDHDDARRIDAAVHLAAGNGWLPLDADREAFRTLNRLVAWLLFEGSIDERYVPTFVTRTRSDRHRLIGLFDDLAIDYRVEGSSITIRYRPAVHASVLGRLLSLLGVPVGTSVVGTALPAYLEDALRWVRREFLETRRQVTGEGSLDPAPTR